VTLKKIKKHSGQNSFIRLTKLYDRPCKTNSNRDCCAATRSFGALADTISTLRQSIFFDWTSFSATFFSCILSRDVVFSKIYDSTFAFKMTARAMLFPVSRVPHFQFGTLFFIQPHEQCSTYIALKP